MVVYIIEIEHSRFKFSERIMRSFSKTVGYIGFCHRIMTIKKFAEFVIKVCSAEYCIRFDGIQTRLYVG